LFLFDFGDLALGTNNEQASTSAPKVAKGTLFQEKPTGSPNAQKIDVANFRRLLLAWLVGILSGQLDDDGNPPAAGGMAAKPDVGGSSSKPKGPGDDNGDNDDTTTGKGKGKKNQGSTGQQNLPVRPKTGTGGAPATTASGSGGGGKGGGGGGSGGKRR